MQATRCPQKIMCYCFNITFSISTLNFSSIEQLQQHPFNVILEINVLERIVQQNIWKKNKE